MASAEEEKDFFGFDLGMSGEDGNEVFGQYLYHLANGQLRRYKGIVHYSNSADGGKRGQSYYNHVIDLVSLAEKLRPYLKLKVDEFKCILLALTVHDINKIPPYSKASKYNDAARLQDIEAELVTLGANDFFPEWYDYRHDIHYLVHAHREGDSSVAVVDQARLEDCKIRSARLKRPLASLMKAVDGADNAHTGVFEAGKDKNNQIKVLQKINEAMPDQQYRWLGHRLAELRGLFTNTIHNVLISYFREKYGQNECIDLLYYPDGVYYLLDEGISLEWGEAVLHEVAGKVEKKLAEIQGKELAKFIQAKPWGIAVDDAAISSGAPLENIFDQITFTVARKQQYKLADWREEREKATRADLSEALASGKLSEELCTLIAKTLARSVLIVSNDEVLRRGELVTAYCNFLKKHRESRLKARRTEAWARAYQLFGLPDECRPLYNLVNPYRRGYFLAPDLPVLDLGEIQNMLLQDLEELEQESQQSDQQPQLFSAASTDGAASNNGLKNTPVEAGYILDYLRRNLTVWDSRAATGTLSVPDFTTSLRQYANPANQYKQCCYCNSQFKTGAWMTDQVPPDVGVQFFSNRLRGGGGEPKRNVCPVCRTQFILEKLAWKSPGGSVRIKRENGKFKKQDITTFYLHLFPYSFFTQPLLNAWWQSIQKVKGTEHSTWLINTADYFIKHSQLLGPDWQRESMEVQKNLERFLEPISTRPANGNGVGVPDIAEAFLSNTPVIPIFGEGGKYGLQFLNVLEKAVVLASWFDCRAILSRSPIPPLNLAGEKVGVHPVSLLVDGRPRNLAWLLPETSLARVACDTPTKPGQVDSLPSEFDLDMLYYKLGLLHRLRQKLAGTDLENVTHELAVAAADDPLALFYQADRLIEKRVAAEKHKPAPLRDRLANQLALEVGPILQALYDSSVSQ